mmetsp:Transcript_44289/g.96238  ORF Transcript_44289/g.96238 Transcript_44289/m.96238 type:complete len:200 (+) Transcript_44289:1482-2081(+)
MLVNLLRSAERRSTGIGSFSGVVLASAFPGAAGRAGEVCEVSSAAALFFRSSSALRLFPSMTLRWASLSSFAEVSSFAAPAPAVAPATGNELSGAGEAAAGTAAGAAGAGADEVMGTSETPVGAGDSAGFADTVGAAGAAGADGGVLPGATAEAFGGGGDVAASPVLGFAAAKSFANPCCLVPDAGAGAFAFLDGAMIP